MRRAPGSPGLAKDQGEAGHDAADESLPAENVSDSVASEEAEALEVADDFGDEEFEAP